jgi:OmpA-OmpF porin, OOP family
MKNCHIMTSSGGMILFILLVCTTSAFAGKHAGTADLTLFGGGYHLGSQPFDSGMTWGFGLGFNFDEKIGTEFTFNEIGSEHKGSDAHIFLYKLDLLYHLIGNLPENVVPYVAGGAGVAVYDLNEGGVAKKYDLILNVGGGLKYFLTSFMALRGDARYVCEFRGDHIYNNILYTAGLSFEFGGAGKEVVVLAPVSEEKCPPGSAGCEEKNWCLKDSDGDGVPDCLDKCPGTPKGTKVDANGCPPEPGTFIFRNTLFDFNKATINPALFPILDEVAGYLKDNPDVKIEIQGHTDSVGSAEYNMRLSEKRADSVKKYLEERGISGDRLEAKGFGLTKPIAPNDTDQNRAKNRRVELKRIQ